MLVEDLSGQVYGRGPSERAPASDQLILGVCGGGRLNNRSYEDRDRGHARLQPAQSALPVDRVRQCILTELLQFLGCHRLRLSRNNKQVQARGHPRKAKLCPIPDDRRGTSDSSRGHCNSVGPKALTDLIQVLSGRHGPRSCPMKPEHQDGSHGDILHAASSGATSTNGEEHEDRGRTSSISTRDRGTAVDHWLVVALPQRVTNADDPV
jgi:hypothetical protein